MESIYIMLEHPVQTSREANCASIVNTNWLMPLSKIISPYAENTDEHKISLRWKNPYSRMLKLRYKQIHLRALKGTYYIPDQCVTCGINTAHKYSDKQLSKITLKWRHSSTLRGRIQEETHFDNHDCNKCAIELLKSARNNVTIFMTKCFISEEGRTHRGSLEEVLLLSAIGSQRPACYLCRRGLCNGDSAKQYERYIHNTRNLIIRS